MLDQSGESVVARVEVLEAVAGALLGKLELGPVTLATAVAERIRRTRELARYEVTGDQAAGIAVAEAEGPGASVAPEEAEGGAATGEFEEPESGGSGGVEPAAGEATAKSRRR